MRMRQAGLAAQTSLVTTTLCVLGVHGAHGSRAVAWHDAAPPALAHWDVMPVNVVTSVPTQTLVTPEATPTRYASAPPPPAAPRARLLSADGRLDTAVGAYGDCHGSAPLPRDEAAIDVCVPGRTYFVGHNPGVFAPLLDEPVGGLISWWDGSGVRQELRIVARRTWARSESGGLAPPVSGDVAAQFQTCLSTSEELIVDAVLA
jgi:hypothetical protein